MALMILHNLHIQEISSSKLWSKMLLANQIWVFFHPQYLLNGLVSELDF